MDKLLKRVSTRVLLLTAVVLLIFANGMRAEEIESVFITRDGVVSPTQLNVNIDETPEMQFGYQLLPTDSTVSEVVWKLGLSDGTDSSSYASVDDTGAVTFFKATERTNPLLLTCIVDEIESAPVEINVVNPSIELTGMSSRFDPVYVDNTVSSVDLYQNLVPIPADATIFNTDCVFSSSNSEFVIDRTTGIMTIPETDYAETIISAELIGNPQISTSFTLIARKPIAVEGIKAENSYTLPTGKTHKIEVELLPSDNTQSLETGITYFVDNPDVVSVDQFGTITAKNPGTATVTSAIELRDEEGNKDVKTAKTNIQVIQNVPVEGIAVDETDIDMTTISNGTTQKQLEVYFSPENTTERDLTFTSLSPEVAMVDENGLIVAKSDGRSTISIEDEANHVIFLTVNVSSAPVVAEYSTVTANDPDEFTVIIKNLHANKALNFSDSSIDSVSCFAFSNNQFQDLNAQTMQQTSNSNDFVAVFQTNGAGNNFFKNASNIKLHLYAKVNGIENFLGVLYYNYTNHGTVPTNLTATPYAENIGFITQIGRAHV